LIEQFDHSLKSEATTLTSLVREDPDGSLDFGFSDDVPAALSKARHATFLEVARSDGTVLMRSGNLAGHNLLGPRAGDRPEKVGDITLPDGEAGRAVMLRFSPQLDRDDDDVGAGDAKVDPHRIAPPPQPLWLMLARDRHEIDETLAVIGSSMLIVAAAFAVVSGLVVIVAVRQALRPLVRISDEAERIGPHTLDARFSTERLPAELRAICHRLNDLLQRLGDAFARERRFTADAAHELRTPIAELRTLAEVALRWPTDASASRQSHQDVLAISQQMERLVNALLAIARHQAGAAPLALERVDVSALIRDAWRNSADEATAKRITFACAGPDSAPIAGDGAMLRRLFENLLNNAIAYSPAGSEIACDITRDSTGVTTVLTNPANDITADDLPHLAEPFWRKDPARTGGIHSGLGLAVVAAYARAMNAAVEFALPAAGVFRVRITLANPEASYSDVLVK
jgi:two-component system sensor histidine kinase QseC